MTDLSRRLATGSVTIKTKDSLSFILGIDC